MQDGDIKRVDITLERTWKQANQDLWSEKLVTTTMDPGQDPDDFFFVLDECRQQLEDMGESVHDERYEDSILQALPAE